MPIALSPLSRRQFLRGALAGAGVMALGPRWSRAASLPPSPPPAVDPDRLALFADTHIAADRGREARGIRMWDQFHIASEQLLAASRKTRPAAMLVNGDCAFSRGQPQDYVTFLDALAPIRRAGLPIHLALGNHDHRANILAALPPDERAAVADVADRRLSVLRMPHADVYLLDSLDQTNVTPGLLGAAQRAWLEKSLDARPKRPALVLMHHQPDERPITSRSGLLDTPEFLAIVQPRRQVKAVFFGHTHIWSHRQVKGLHLVNLPTSAYVFQPEQPAGWVDARVGERALRLQLRCVSKAHPKDNEVLDLAYRA